MPVRMLNFLKQPPPRPKGRASSITQTPEWQDLMLSLGAGLKPQEYIDISFPPEHCAWRMMKDPITAFVRATKLKVEELKLPYDVYVIEKVIYVVGRGVIS